ncbi:unnamed protein product [Leptosia nina]|uniref:Uncharacterized protein n=1 Tax=Leptosia nina TaxID=320188 RepID=A0AAV1JTA5_9NEOP
MTCTCNDITVTKQFDHKKHEDVTEAVTQKIRKRCCPYNFDGKICRTVGDRLLCGYNRNIGSPRGDDGLVNLNNGCIIRRGRLECGYIEPPYMNSRRPPVRDEQQVPNENINEENESDNEIESQKETEVKHKLLLKKTTRPYQLSNKYRGSTRCLEIQDRIVCRQF